MSNYKHMTNWIAIDWGTTHLRAWLMDNNNSVLERRDSDQGMSVLEPNQFEHALIHLLGDICTGTPITTIICGMAGSRQGWKEAPYNSAPCPPPGIGSATCFKTQHFQVSILPGVKQTQPADVMRGEETQISGFLSTQPEFEGLLCLPGTHNKWVRIAEGKIKSFQTFMTGELYKLISDQSVLRHAVDTQEWDQIAFEKQLKNIINQPDKMAANLFSLRAEGLLHDLTAIEARSRLSAILIGTELSAAKQYWNNEKVIVLGEGSVAEAYYSALISLDANAEKVNAESMTLAGLIAAYLQMDS